MDAAVQSDYLYFDSLHINPIKINLSFQTVGAIDHTEVRPSALEKVLSYAGTLANIEDSPLLLRGLFLSNPFETQATLTNIIIAHYTNQGVKQLYKIVGSADFLGNPVGLITNLGSGVKDFFFEPAKGLVKGPKEFGKGLAKGTSSLAKKSIFGIFNTAEKLTKTVARVGETLTFDEDYQKQRAITKKRKAQHVGQGLAYGVMDLGIGVYKGVTGVVTEPIRGGMKGGAVGVAKGVGRGLAGLILKPTIGAIDLFSRTAEGIKNTTTYFDHNTKARVRPPRYIPIEGRICMYDFEKSVGQQLLRVLHDGIFKHHHYLFHCFTTKKHCVLASTTTLWYLVKTTIGETAWKANWQTDLAEVVDVALKGQHVLLTTDKAERDIACQTKDIQKHVLQNLFGLANIKPREESTIREQVTQAYGAEVFEANVVDEEDTALLLSKRGRKQRARIDSDLEEGNEKQPLLGEQASEPGCCKCCNIL